MKTLKNHIVTITLLLIGIIITPFAIAQTDTEIRLANEYYSKGEFDKAIKLYADLSKNWRNIPLIHNNYLFLLLESENFKESEKYVNKVIKKFPENIYYELDLGLVYEKQGDLELAEVYFTEIINNAVIDSYKTRIISQYFVNNELTNYAIKMFKIARIAVNNPYIYSLEMANIYRINNKKDLMVEEYLNYIIQNPSNLNYIKNTLQNLLRTTEELESLSTLLYDRVQKHPENNMYNELLIWVNLQQKNFYGAFIQARALDRRLKTNGARSNKIGLIALDNNAYDIAIKIFEYVIKNYFGTPHYIMARMYLIKTQEERARKTYPIDEEEIRNLIHDYNVFIAELGINRNTLEALRNKALLHAFYLDEKDSAIQVLERIIKTPQANSNIKAKSKLNLGDIHLLLDEPWEATLYYAQVEKSHKETQIGYDAKLRNAKLSYYKGDFKLAQEHLDILKEATTREIANDAMNLSLIIKDNTVLDTTDEVMIKYARIELLLFQHKKEDAFMEIQEMKKLYAHHSIMDELLWSESKILLELGDFKQSIISLQEIVENYDYDIWSDDAYYKMAYIYDFHLNDKTKAQEIYRDFLTRYPGSVFVSDARNRYRELRGDFKSTEEAFEKGIEVN